jgi:RNA recognition motif-containing protein
MYAVFSQFGKIIDVVALKTLRLRGQAWVVFADVAAATNAKNTMQGFPFYDKPIVSGSARCCAALRRAVCGRVAGVCLVHALPRRSTVAACHQRVCDASPRRALHANALCDAAHRVCQDQV